MLKHNKERKNANISLFILILSVFAALVPFITDADMMQWGYGVFTISLVVALTTFFVFLMFNSRAKVLNRIFMQDNVLIHYHYNASFWKEICDEDYKDSGIGKIVGFFLGGIFFIIGTVVFLADTDDNGMFFIIMAFISVFFIFIGFISVYAQRKRIKESIPEAIITKEGLFYKNTLYTWNNRAISFLESVSLNPLDSTMLLFVIRQLSGGRGHAMHYHPHYINIPIPNGEEGSATALISYFNLPLKNERVEEMYDDPE